MRNRKKMLEYAARYLEMRIDSMDTSEAFERAEQSLKNEFGPEALANMSTPALERFLNDYGVLEIYEELEAEEEREAAAAPMIERHQREMDELRARQARELIEWEKQNG